MCARENVKTLSAVGNILPFVLHRYTVKRRNSSNSLRCMIRHAIQEMGHRYTSEPASNVTSQPHKHVLERQLGRI